MTADALMIKLLPYALTTTSAVVASAAILCSQYDQLASVTVFFGLAAAGFGGLALVMLIGREDE